MDKLLKKDLQYIWHPYTQMKDCRKFAPVLIKKAKGIRLYDSRGKFYYDTISSWWCNVHGHNHPKIKQAVKKQLDSLEHVLFAGFTHEPAIKLAEKLISLAPKGLKKVFFSDNGSTAVEVALKMSFQYWHNIGKRKKNKFISLDYGYHGDTVGTMSVSGVDLFNEVFTPLFYPSYKVPSPYCYRCPMGKDKDSCVIDCIKPLEKLLKEKSDEVCAIIIEPMVLGAGGMIIYPKEYLEKTAQLAKENNVHLILDEVATGFGRTGKMFACEHDGIVPDIITIAKGIASGLPLGAMVASASVMTWVKGSHANTFGGNPVACEAALATIELLENGLVENAANVGSYILSALMEMKNRHPLIGDVRGKGLMIGIEFVRDGEKKAKAIEERDAIINRSFKKGLLLLGCGQSVIRLVPPLILSREDADAALTILEEVIDGVEKGV